MTDPETEPVRERRPSPFEEWRVPVILFVLTFGSTLYVGSLMERGASPETLAELVAGWVFAVPLMTILLAHELGHYIAGRIHKVDISPPFFIPLPISLLGTMGAVIRMRGRIRSRNALLDIGASGPLAGMAFALPILIYGIISSPVEALPGRGESATLILEGHSILYKALLFTLKGSFPEGHDISLTSTALAGWAGLLVTMINLIPFGQLDGGHVSYALLGKRQDQVSKRMLIALPILALIVGAYFGGQTFLDGGTQTLVLRDALAGVHWLVWGVVLFGMTRLAGTSDHPPTDDDELSPGRRRVAIFTMLLFLVLFMPSWIREY